MTNETKQPQEYTEIVTAVDFDERNIAEGYGINLCKDSDGDYHCNLTIPNGDADSADNYIEIIRSVVGFDRFIEQTQTLDDNGKVISLTLACYINTDIENVQEDFFGWCEEGGLTFPRETTDIIVEWAIENLGKDFQYFDAIVDWRECDESTAYTHFGITDDEPFIVLSGIVHDLQRTNGSSILFRVSNSDLDFTRK